MAAEVALVSDSTWRIKARIDGRPGRISILLLKNPRPDEEPHFTRRAPILERHAHDTAGPKPRRRRPSSSEDAPYIL
jgi:hypothetical protein